MKIEKDYWKYHPTYGCWSREIFKVTPNKIIDLGREYTYQNPFEK